MEIVHCGKPEKLLKYANRYQLVDINYRPDEPQSVFFACINNFFSESITFKTLHTQRAESLNRFRETYDDMFWNILVLISILKLDARFVQAVGKQILSFIADTDALYNYNVKYLGVFISRRGYQLETDDLKLLFAWCLTNSKFHDLEVFSGFATAATKLKIAFVSSRMMFDTVINVFFEKCAKCNTHHENIIFTIVPSLTTRYKREFQKRLEEKLDATFDEDIYYHAVIYDLIDYKKYFAKYLALLKPVASLSNLRSPFSRGEAVFEGLNRMMNIIFKFKIRTPKTIIQQYKGLSDYYDWLLDMNGFEYSRFNPLWMMHYPTKYYLEKIFSIAKICNAVKRYLQTNNQPTLANYLVAHSK